MMRQEGQSLFETVIAIGLISIVFISLVAFSLGAVRNSNISKNKTSANRYAQEAIEWLRSERDENWLAFYTRATEPLYWCLGALVWPASAGGTCGKISGTIFTRSLTFSLPTTTKVQADVNVSWIDGIINREVKVSTYFSNWRNQ